MNKKNLGGIKNGEDYKDSSVNCYSDSIDVYVGGAS